MCELPIHNLLKNSRGRKEVLSSSCSSEAGWANPPLRGTYMPTIFKAFVEKKLEGSMFHARHILVPHHVQVFLSSRTRARILGGVTSGLLFPKIERFLYLMRFAYAICNESSIQQ